MTVSELKARMTQDELNTWVAYIEENGPLNQSLRMEASIARAVSPFLKNTNPRDLMMWPRQPEKPASLKDVFGVLLTASKSGKRKS